MKKFVLNWAHDLVHNPWVFGLELLGTVSAMLAATILAWYVPQPPFLLVYGLYILGSTCLAVASYLRHNGFWWMLSVFFVSIDILGVYRLLR